MELINRQEAIAAVQRAIDGDSFFIDLPKAIAKLPAVETLHDGCDGCKYEHREADDLPCVTCKQNYMDCWTEKMEAKSMGRKLIDQEELIEKLWRLIKDDDNKDMQGGLLQAVLVAQLMDTEDKE